MRGPIGAVVSVAASLALLSALVWPYVARPAADIGIYYGSGLINPLIAGALAIGVVAAFAIARWGNLSTEAGTGIALGLGVFVLLVVLAWAGTGRVDVFRAPGWAFPMQRWVLVGLAALIVLGAGWQTWTHGLLSARR